MSEIKLLPCPICNGEVVFRYYFENFSDGPLYKIVCPHCDLHFKGSVDGKVTGELAKKWNTRKPMERILTRLEEKEREVNKKRLDSIEPLEHEFLEGKSTGYKELMEIVKEEGGIE